MRSSDFLTVGEIYSRARLGEIFGINPVSFQRGVFKLRDHESVWLFVTEEAGEGQMQREDALQGDVLRWGGVGGGRSEALVLEHAARGLELILFHRLNDRQYRGRGFCYEGRFVYVGADATSAGRHMLRREA